MKYGDKFTSVDYSRCAVCGMCSLKNLSAINVTEQYNQVYYLYIAVMYELFVLYTACYNVHFVFNKRYVPLVFKLNSDCLTKYRLQN
jgi:hypothetical protein